MKPLTHLRPIVLAITLLLFGLNGFGQPPTYHDYTWGQGIIAGNTTAAYYKAMDVDTLNERVVVTGTFTDTAFAGSSSLSGGGMYIASYDTSGVLQWLKKEGFAYMPSIFGLFCPSPMDIEVDGQGNILIAGTLCGDSINDINGITFTNNGYFIAKYAASGTLIWLKTYNVTPTTTWFRNIILETGYNEAFAAFSYGDSVVLGGVTLHGHSTQSNVALIKLDQNGSIGWRQNFAGDFISAKDMVYDHDSTLYFAGDYDSLYTSLNTLPDANNSFISKINTNTGFLLAVKSIGRRIPNSFDCNVSAIDLLTYNFTTRLVMGGRFQGDYVIGTDTLHSIPGQGTELWYGSFDLNLNNKWVNYIPVVGADDVDDILALDNHFVVAGRLGVGHATVAGDSIKGYGFLVGVGPLGDAFWTLQQPDSAAIPMTDIEGFPGTRDIYMGGGINYRGIFNQDTVFNKAWYANTVSEVSYVAKVSVYSGCNITAWINAGADTLISCQAVQPLNVITQHSSSYLSYIWSPANYLSSSTVANPTVSEQVHLQSFTVEVLDSATGCTVIDTIVVGVYLPHMDSIYLCPGDSVVLDLGAGATMYDWSGFPNPAPLSQTVVADTAGTYWGVATYNTAPALCGSLTSLFIITDSCTVVQLPDSVWPGDANSDGLADLYDVLNIGIGYNIAGPIRTNASTVWTGQASQDWNLAFLNGLNLKHADCDGNGLIDSLDVDVVSLNYGLTHAKAETPVRRPGAPQLVVNFTVDTTQAPGLITADVSLGDATMQVVDGYGIAFSLLFDPTLVDSSSIQASYANSWLGAGGNPRSLTKNLYNAGKLDLAYTRTTHTNVSGYGHIATVSFYIQDNIIGKDLATYNFGLEVTGSRLISANESQILLDEVGDQVLVQDEFTGIGHVSAPEVNIYPNPGNGIYTLSVISAGAEATVTITNLLGQQVFQTVVDSQPQAAVLPVDLSAEAGGIYLVKVQSNNTTVVKRLVKQ